MNRLDLPIQEFMEKTYILVLHGKVHKNEIYKFIQEFSRNYAMNASFGDVAILRAEMTMKKINETFTNIFKCLVETSRPDKQGMVKVKKVELLWKEKNKEDNINNDEKLFILTEFLDCMNIEKTAVDSSSDDEVK